MVRSGLDASTLCQRESLRCSSTFRFIDHADWRYVFYCLLGASQIPRPEFALLTWNTGMRLSDFINANIESILQAWEDFARTIDTPGTPLDTEALRDHAEQMLHAIVLDLRTKQSAKEQLAKAHGNAPTKESETPAETHAVTRLMAGFTIDQMVSEYRALRASVLSQWSKQVKAGTPLDVDDMTRFHEAIDQALAESIASYSRAVEASRNVFLGILGHDLRTPLGAILLGADVLRRSEGLAPRATKIASQIFASVKRASQIVGDLLDLTRCQMGPGIPVKKERLDLALLCERIVDEIRAFHPSMDIRFEKKRSRKVCLTVRGWSRFSRTS